MELTPRKKAIIAEIVKCHIESGEPIGSKLLASRLPSAPSSATLRNEMSELEKMGYLEQPHTSAGRVPTSRAYRLYVNELMSKDGLPTESRQIIDKMLSEVSLEPENIGSAAAQILTTLTGLPTVYAENAAHEIRLRKVNLMPLGRASAIVFAITDDGRTRSRLVPFGSSLTAETVALFNQMVKDKVCGMPIGILNKAYLQSLTVSAGLEALSLAPLFSVLFDMADELSRTRVNLSGESNLFSLLGSDKTANSVLKILNTGDTVQSILSEVSDPVGVIFGDDTEYDELKPTGMIIASYGEHGEFGRLAVIGPTRMSYERILPSVEYLAGQIGKIMNEMLKGLEE